MDKSQHKKDEFGRLLLLLACLERENDLRLTAPADIGVLLGEAAAGSLQSRVLDVSRGQGLHAQHSTISHLSR